MRKKPTFGACKATVFERGWPHKCGNNAIGSHGKCRVHSPEAVAAREAKANERAEADRAKWQRKFAEDKFNAHARSFYDALKAIADGDNNARQLARDVISGKTPPT